MGSITKLDAEVVGRTRLEGRDVDVVKIGEMEYVQWDGVLIQHSPRWGTPNGSVHKASSPGALPTNRPATFGEQVAIAKAAPTFAELMTAQEFRTWWPAALDAMAQVVDAALTAPAEEGISPALRMQAAITAVDQFRDSFLERIAGAIGKRAVAKRSARNGGTPWRGIL